MPKVSIIVTSFNHQHYITDCLDAILLQKTNFDFEVILGDDASSDDTAIIMQSYAKRLPTIFHFFPAEKNLGITGNLERCLNEAKGEFIAICEGDDYWIDEYKLQKQVDFLEQHSDCSMCFNNKILRYENKNNYKLGIQQAQIGNNYYKTLSDLIKENFIGNFSCCMYRNRIVKKINPDIYKLSIADWMFNMACAEFGPIGYIEQWMSVYRIHQKGAWSGLSARKKAKDVLELIPQYDAFFEHKYTEQFNISIVSLNARAFLSQNQMIATLKDFIRATKIYKKIRRID
jgi:glycosyltransferase involved in cell wall biosynthesis